MLKNYLAIAFRQLRRQRMYAAVKIGGFALSIAACLLIALYIQNELSYDRTYPDAGRIFRVVGYFGPNGSLQKWTAFPAPMAGAIKKDFPEVQRSGRLMPARQFSGNAANEIKPEGARVNSYEEGFTYADQDLITLLQLPVVAGQREQALTEPHTIVLTQSKAAKLFPGQNAVGKSLILNNEPQPWRVTAVVKDLPATSHLHFNYFLSLVGIQWWEGEQNDWGANNYTNYLLLRPGTNIQAFEKKLTADLCNNYYLPTLLKNGDKNAASELAKVTFRLQPISDIHLYSTGIHDGISTHGDIRFIYIFGAIAVFILIIACINFINLSTAKAANRAKEVGLRKVIGAQRGGLIRQFLVESIVYSVLSFVIGILLAWLILPYFNVLAARALSMPWTAVWLIPGLLLAALCVGIAAGIYPAFYLSSFKPAKVLKGEISRGSKSSVLRNALVIFQFATSVILMISTTVIYSQTKYVLGRPSGYDKDQVVLLRGTHTLGTRIGDLKKALLQLPEVKNASISGFLPVTDANRNGNVFWKAGRMNIDPAVDGQFWDVDTSYIATLGMQLVAGRNFYAADSLAVVINQTLANALQLKDPIGKRIVNNNGITFTVIGVVRDFNFESMRDKVKGLAMHLNSSPSILALKLGTADMTTTLGHVTAVWKKFAPDQPIRYTFLDEDFASMYADLRRMAGIFTAFALLAVSIACLGLFALSAFMAEQRAKEIGIRKVLGATVTGIAALMSKDFLRLVLLAFLIASPLAWWGMNLWLRDFAYRISIGWWVFVFAGGAAFAIALFTVSFQSIRSAMANPVKSLRND
jgi:putative ABC transport system permease protein